MYKRQRLDYKNELSEGLGIKKEIFQQYPDNYSILKAYSIWGEDCVKHLYGDFSFAIWNRRKKELFCARDHFGIRPLYFYNHPDYFIFSSDFQVFNKIPNITLHIKEKFIINTVCTITPEKDSSAYYELYKLEPAHTLKIDKNGTISISKYWDCLLYTSDAADE